MSGLFQQRAWSLPRRFSLVIIVIVVHSWRGGAVGVFLMTRRRFDTLGQMHLRPLLIASNKKEKKYLFFFFWKGKLFDMDMDLKVISTDKINEWKFFKKRKYFFSASNSSRPCVWSAHRVRQMDVRVVSTSGKKVFHHAPHSRDCVYIFNGTGFGVLVANGKAKLVSIQIKFPTFSRMREKIKKFPVDIRSSTDNNYSYLAVCGCSFSVREYNSWCWIICCCLEKMQPNRTARQRTKETRCDFFPILTTTRKTCSSLAFSR